jgi:ATP-binding cassette, subfamily C, bacteriocin exporter
MKKAVLQRRLTDCGPACLLSVAYYYSLVPTLRELRAISKTNWTGTSMENLVVTAQLLGLKATPVWADIESMKNVTLPVIAHIKIWKFLPHYIVIYKIGIEKLEIMDPGLGIFRVISISEFEKKWTKALIIFQDVD